MEEDSSNPVQTEFYKGGDNGPRKLKAFISFQISGEHDGGGTVPSTALRGFTIFAVVFTFSML